MNVTAQVPQVCLGLDMKRLISILKERTGLIVGIVVRFGIGVEDTLRQQACRRFAILPDQSMETIGQQTVGDDRHLK